MNLTAYDFQPGSHKNKNVIWISFQFNLKLKNDLKNRFPSAKYSKSERKWYLPDFPSVRKQLNIDQNPIENQYLNRIQLVNKKALLDFVNQLKLKAYSPNTIKTYVNEFAHLLILLKNHPVDQLTPDRLKAYFLYCLKKENIKEQQLNSRINAVKFYFD